MDFEQRIESLCYGAQPTAREAVKLGKSLNLPDRITKVATFTNNYGEESAISFLPIHYATPYPRLHQHEGGGDLSSGVVALPHRFNWVHLVIMLQEYLQNPATLHTIESHTIAYVEWWVVSEHFKLPEVRQAAQTVEFYESWAHSSIWVMRPSGLGVFLTCLCRM